MKKPTLRIPPYSSELPKENTVYHTTSTNLHAYTRLSYSVYSGLDLHSQLATACRMAGFQLGLLQALYFRLKAGIKASRSSLIAIVLVGTEQYLQIRSVYNISEAVQLMKFSA